MRRHTRILRPAIAAMAFPAFLGCTEDARVEPAAKNVDTHETVRALADHATDILLTPSGQGRADYDIVSGQWRVYEPHWHTGQLILGLVEAWELTGEDRYLEAARRAGDWWVGTEFQPLHPFAGLVDAAHGDRLGRLINWTTISDGTPGLFALSRATGDPRYADTATRSARWLWENTRVERPGGEGLFYNLFDPETGEVYRDWDAHTRGPGRDPAQARAASSPVTRVARPNIEGYLFADTCRHTGEQVWCDRFVEQARWALARQDENGLWMAFEPNEPETGKIHPRFNLWNAEALVVAYDVSGDRAFLEGAARTARFHAKLARSDGTLYYDSYVGRPARRAGVTGSAVAFLGLLMMDLEARGYAEFDEAIDRSARWLEANRFAADHPDPNLAGAVVNTRMKRADGATVLLNRDVGTTFGLRFLARYAAHP